MSLTYTTIQHDFRKRNQLTLTEYIICDMVYFLATNPKNKVPGWCWMSRSKMADEIDLSKRQLIRIVNKLEQNELLIRDTETNFLKPSMKWSEVYFKGGEIMSQGVTSGHGGGEIMSRDGGDMMSPNNNSLNNNRDKSKSEDLIFESLLEKSKEIFSEAGLKGQFFSKIQKLYRFSDVEVNQYFFAWKKKHETLGTEFRTPDHLRNSFNRFCKESGSSKGFKSEAPQVAISKNLI